MKQIINKSQAYKWASLIAQLVKNPPAMQETLVRFLVREDLLEKGKATHSSVLEKSMDCIVALTFTLCNSHHHPSPEHFTFLN